MDNYHSAVPLVRFFFVHNGAQADHYASPQPGVFGSDGAISEGLSCRRKGRGEEIVVLTSK